MKRLLILSLAAFAAASLVADGVPAKRGRPGGASTPSGGIVEKPYAGKVFRVSNAQDKVSPEKIAALVQQMRWTSLLPIEAADGASFIGQPPFAAADALVSQPNVGAGVLIVEDAALPMTLVAPECRWTILNIAPLLADAPTPEKLEQRFEKMLWCAVARTLGAGYSSYKPCVLVPFLDLRALDRITATKPCPEPFNKMIDTGAEYGIKTISIASYRDACHKGWAPPPKDEVQQKIWDEVHAIPQNPMKIEFDPKKGR